MKGFTLIEVLVYLALYSIIIGGAVLGAYSIIESSGRNQTKAMVEEEGGFLAGKIEWAAQSGDPGLVFSSAGGAMLLARDGAAPEVLNNSNTAISDFVSVQRGPSSFTLSARTPQGALYSESFSTAP